MTISPVTQPNLAPNESSEKPVKVKTRKLVDIQFFYDPYSDWHKADDFESLRRDLSSRVSLLPKDLVMWVKNMILSNSRQKTGTVLTKQCSERFFGAQLIHRLEPLRHDTSSRFCELPRDLMEHYIKPMVRWAPKSDRELDLQTVDSFKFVNRIFLTHSQMFLTLNETSLSILQDGKVVLQPAEEKMQACLNNVKLFEKDGQFLGFSEQIKNFKMTCFRYDIDLSYPELEGTKTKIIGNGLYKGVHVDADRNVYFINHFSIRILDKNFEPRFIMTFPKPGCGSSCYITLENTFGVDKPNGLFYICVKELPEAYGKCFKLATFSSEGEFISFIPIPNWTNYSSSENHPPQFLKVDASGNLLMGINETIFLYSPKGEILRAINPPGHIDDAFIGDDGKVYIYDKNWSQVIAYQ